MFSIYWNLHKKCWSIRNKNGLVIDHASQLCMVNCTFKVWEGGRQRVIKEKRKNVHAFVRSPMIVTFDDGPPENAKRVSYNPYKGSSFYLADTQEPIENCAKAWLTQEGKVYIMEQPANDTPAIV